MPNKPQDSQAASEPQVRSSAVVGPIRPYQRAGRTLAKREALEGIKNWICDTELHPAAKAAALKFYDRIAKL